MADLSLTIHTEPPIAFYQGARPASVDQAWPRLIGFSGLRQELRRGGGGENSNVSARLNNGDGALTPWFADAPLLSEVSMCQDGAEIWRGVLVSITCSGQISLNMEA